MSERKSSTPSTLQGASVLLVEDDQEVLDMTVTVLERAGAHVTGAINTEDALEALSMKRFSCAVIDWNLGASNADAILATVRNKDADLAGRTVVVTGDFLASGDEASARGYGFHVMAKPFRPRQLLETLARLLAKPRAST